MRIGPAANVARINVNEIITAFWTIGGVGLRNTAIDLLGLGSPANRVLGSDVDGDAEERFRLHAGGIMQWGDGAGARDTQLQRDDANELGTPDDFNVGGTIDLAGKMELSIRSPAAIVADVDDFATGTTIIQRLQATGAVDITGFAGGADGRMIIVLNFNVQVITLKHNDVGSASANRMQLPGTADIALSQNDSVTMFYESVNAKWHVAGSAL